VVEGEAAAGADEAGEVVARGWAVAVVARGWAEAAECRAPRHPLAALHHSAVLRRDLVEVFRVPRAALVQGASDPAALQVVARVPVVLDRSADLRHLG